MSKQREERSIKKSIDKNLSNCFSSFTEGILKLIFNLNLVLSKTLVSETLAVAIISWQPQIKVISLELNHNYDISMIYSCN